MKQKPSANGILAKKSQKLEIIDNGVDHTDNIIKEYELSQIPTKPFNVIVTKYDNKKNRVGTKTVSINKIKVLRDKQNIIFGHLRFM
jgi:hypothetical protein